MRRLTGTEKAALALASVLIVGGLCMILHPLEMFVTHSDKAPYVAGVGTASQHISNEEARFIGGGAVLLGPGIAALVLYSPRK